MLCGELAVLQAPMFDGLSLDPFAVLDDGCRPAKIGAVGLIAANVSKKASNTPALLSRSNRFQTVFQWLNSFGNARQRTFSTVKKCSTSRNFRSSTALRARRGRQLENQHLGF